jgi:UDP-glucose 4-epimerase
MRVLVTGGAGFIGSHLVERLLQSGYFVTALDDLSTGAKENLTVAEEHPNFRFVEGSAADFATLTPLMAQTEQVYHLAASVGVRRIVEQLVDSIENTIKSTEAVLQLAAQHNTRLLITSTSEVYGRSTKEPFKEDDDLRMGPTLKARWSYACSKALDEYLAFAYHHERGLPVAVVRLFNTVGERQTAEHGMVLPTFVQQALASQPLTVHGDGSQSRCFCHVSDVVTALQSLMEHTDAVGQVYNIGSTEEISVTKLAEKVIDVTKSTSVIAYVPYTQAFSQHFEDIDRRVPNISKIKEAIGWRPTVGLSEIISRTAIACRDNELEISKQIKARL